MHTVDFASLSYFCELLLCACMCVHEHASVSENLETGVMNIKVRDVYPR